MYVAVAVRFELDLTVDIDALLTCSYDVVRSEDTIANVTRTSSPCILNYTVIVFTRNYTMIVFRRKSSECCKGLYMDLKQCDTVIVESVFDDFRARTDSSTLR